MASVNKVILLGTLGRDPEVRFSANQLPIASLSLRRLLLDAPQKVRTELKRPNGIE